MGIVTVREIGAKMGVAAAAFAPLQGSRGHHLGNLANIARLMHPHELMVVVGQESRFLFFQLL